MRWRLKYVPHLFHSVVTKINFHAVLRVLVENLIAMMDLDRPQRSIDFRRTV